jgi:hypothetical protein
MDWMLDLLTPLGATSNYGAIDNFHILYSPHHPLNLFQPTVSSTAVPWQQVLTVEILQFPAQRVSFN